MAETNPNSGVTLMSLQSTIQSDRKVRSIRPRQAAGLAGLLLLAGLTTAGTCVVVEESPYPEYEEPGINADRMEEQEIEVMEEEDR